LSGQGACRVTTSPDRENQVRTRLAAGGRGIRTLGPSRDGVTDSRGGEGAAGWLCLSTEAGPHPKNWL